MFFLEEYRNKWIRIAFLCNRLSVSIFLHLIPWFFPPREELQEKYEGRMEKEMTGSQFELISKIFKGLCNRKIVTPGNFVG